MYIPIIRCTLHNWNTICTIFSSHTVLYRFDRYVYIYMYICIHIYKCTYYTYTLLGQYVFLPTRPCPAVIPLLLDLIVRCFPEILDVSDWFTQYESLTLRQYLKQ